MKTLLVEIAYKEQFGDLRSSTGYMASDSELAWLYKKDTPPPFSQVWIAPFDAAGEYATTHQAHRLGMNTPDGEIPCHLTTLTIGMVLFQVFSVDFVLAEKAGLPPYTLSPPLPASFALRPIWPISAPLNWPTSPYVDLPALKMIQDWNFSPPVAPPLAAMRAHWFEDGGE